MITKRFYYTMEDLGVNKSLLLNLIGDTPINDKLVDMIELKYSENWIAYNDVDYWPGIEPVEEIPTNDKWLKKFKFIYEASKDRYEVLINNYNTQKDNLMNQLESNNVTKFNDTPSDNRDLTGNGFTSTVTTSNSKIDNTTVMNRLSEIYNSFRNLYKNWVDEFNEIFGEM